MCLRIGDKAPDFTLKTKTADGLEEVTLSDNFGTKNTLLLFFPLAFTSVCTQEMCSVSRGIEEYDDMNAVVYGISVDSPFALEAFAKSAGITVPLLSDFNKEVSKNYDVQYAELLGLKGVAKRSAFVINKQGVIIYSEASNNPTQLPDFNKIRTVLSDEGALF